MPRLVRKVDQLPTHFTAVIRLLSTDESGRKTPIKSGFRCALNMGVYGMVNDCQLLFEDQDFIEPGAEGKALVFLLAPEFQRGRLFAGFVFDLQEGNKRIGTGQVLDVVDPDLRRSDADSC